MATFKEIKTIGHIQIGKKKRLAIVHTQIEGNDSIKQVIQFKEQFYLADENKWMFCKKVRIGTNYDTKEPEEVHSIQFQIDMDPDLNYINTLLTTTESLVAYLHNCKVEESDINRASLDHQDESPYVDPDDKPF